MRYITEFHSAIESSGKAYEEAKVAIRMLKIELDKYVYTNIKMIAQPNK